MDFWGTITLLATLCGCSSLIPEVIKALKSRHLRDLSWGMLFLLLVCSGLWTLYGILSNEMPLIISGSFNVGMEIILIILKNIYDQKDRLVAEKRKMINKPSFQSVIVKNEV